MMENCLIKNPNEIITRFNNGDTTAYQEVYKLFYEHMQYTVSGILGGQTAAVEDIVNDAFIKCWDKRGSFETLQKAKCYIYVVAKHSAFHLVEKRKTQAAFESSYQRVGDHKQETVLDTMFYRETINCLYDEIKQLPQRQKHLLELFYVQNLSYAEVAALLNKPVQHIRVEKSRGLNLLKKNIQTKYSWLYQ